MERYPLVLHTDRLLLTSASEGLAPRVCRFVNDNREHLARWEPRRSEEYYTEPLWRDELREAEREYLEGRSLRLILAASTDAQGPVLGVCNYRNFVRGAFHSCHLGYSLDHRYEGRGLMFEALQASIAYVFGSLNIHRVMANHLPGNERSERLLARLGFEREGYARDYLYIDGAWRDHILTSKINPAWTPPDEEGT